MQQLLTEEQLSRVKYYSKREKVIKIPFFIVFILEVILFVAYSLIDENLDSLQVAIFIFITMAFVDVVWFIIIVKYMRKYYLLSSSIISFALKNSLSQCKHKLYPNTSSVEYLLCPNEEQEHTLNIYVNGNLECELKFPCEISWQNKKNNMQFVNITLYLYGYILEPILNGSSYSDVTIIRKGFKTYGKKVKDEFVSPIKSGGVFDEEKVNILRKYINFDIVQYYERAMFI